jgi:predicted HicB family RNase H-like nuclease
MLEYKGYTGVMEVDDEAGIIFGRVLGLRSVITFQGETVAEARQAFRDSVDDYLDFCAARGKEAERSYSGKFQLRLRPELHRALAHSAERAGTSLNNLIEQRLTEGLREETRSGRSPKGATTKGTPPTAQFVLADTGQPVRVRVVRKKTAAGQPPVTSQKPAASKKPAGTTGAGQVNTKGPKR